LNILFQKKKLQKECNDFRLSQRKHGKRIAVLLRRRLDDLRAADVLADISHLPPTRCHELKGDREGQLAINLKHPYRLIFEPANDPISKKEDGGLDWTKITAILIIEVEDYHGK
jgi:plasmid maintenance system killer protein